MDHEIPLYRQLICTACNGEVYDSHKHMYCKCPVCGKRMVSVLSLEMKKPVLVVGSDASEKETMKKVLEKARDTNLDKWFEIITGKLLEERVYMILYRDLSLDRPEKWKIRKTPIKATSSTDAVARFKELMPNTDVLGIKA